MKGGGTGQYRVALKQGVVSVATAAPAERRIVHNLLQLYLHEMSQFEAREVDENGVFPYKFFDDYWTADSRVALLARAGPIPAGFALINEHTVLDSSRSGVRTIAEFFVLRQFRRLGVGRQLALDAFRLFPGRWEIRQLEENEPAKAFWREVISQYTAARFVELTLDDHRWRGPIQTFDNSLMVG